MLFPNNHRSASLSSSSSITVPRTTVSCSSLAADQNLIPNFTLIHNIILKTTPHVLHHEMFKSRSLCMLSVIYGELSQSARASPPILFQTLCSNAIRSNHTPYFEAISLLRDARDHCGCQLTSASPLLSASYSSEQLRPATQTRSFDIEHSIFSTSFILHYSMHSLIRTVE